MWTVSINSAINDGQNAHYDESCKIRAYAPYLKISLRKETEKYFNFVLFSMNKIVGSSTLASTFSNGANDPNTGVATTDLYGKCTTTHSGTSAAAPEAAGVFALALEAKYIQQ